MTELKKFLSQIEENSPSNCVEVLFSQKTDTKYISHKPAMSSEVQEKILKIIIPSVIDTLSNNMLMSYSSEGCLDGYIEYIAPAEVRNFDAFLESISSDSVKEDLKSLRVEKIDFYCIDVNYDGKRAMLFRRFTKQKKLRRGFLTQLITNQLNVIDEDYLNFDEYVDIVFFESKLLIFSHLSLERIFKYKDALIKKTDEALNEVSAKDLIVNQSSFAEDCKSDIRVMKKFTHIMQHGKLPLFFDNFANVPSVVQELGLDIEFDEDGKLIYTDKSQLPHILQLMSDAYFKSILANRTGVAILEGAVDS